MSLVLGGERVEVSLNNEVQQTRVHQLVYERLVRAPITLDVRRHMWAKVLGKEIDSLADLEGSIERAKR
jgi:hypothetical protein